MTETTDSMTREDAGVLQGVVEEAMDRLHVPGVGVGIVHGGGEIVEGYGVTSVDNPLPVTGDTLFQIGSTTKTITGVMAMQLVEAGRLDLDEPVRRYLPALRLSDPDVVERVTMRHLLTHTGGFEGDYFCDFGRGEDALDQAVQSMAALDQIAPLGAVWSYCNSGFYLAGRVIEAITGMPYERAAQEMVLGPLGMTRSFFFPEDVMTYRFAVGHTVDGETVKVARPWALPRVAHPAGGVTTSARDILRYARFLLGDGTAAGGARLIGEDTLRYMESPLLPAGPNRSIGITWFSQEVDGVRLLSHGGGTNGQVSAFLYAPDRGFALSACSNAGQAGMLEAVTDWALDRYLGISLPRPEPREAGAGELEAYAGQYDDKVRTVTVAFQDGEPVLRVALKAEAMAAISEEAPPAMPQMRLAVSGEDRLVVLDGPYKDAEVELLRGEDGAIVWLRLGGRLHTRQGV